MSNEKDPKVSAKICFDSIGLDPELYRIGHTKAREKEKFPFVIFSSFRIFWPLFEPGFYTFKHFSIHFKNLYKLALRLMKLLPWSWVWKPLVEPSLSIFKPLSSVFKPQVNFEAFTKPLSKISSQTIPNIIQISIIRDYFLSTQFFILEWYHQFIPLIFLTSNPPVLKSSSKLLHFVVEKPRFEKSIASCLQLPHSCPSGNGSWKRHQEGRRHLFGSSCIGPRNVPFGSYQGENFFFSIKIFLEISMKSWKIYRFFIMFWTPFFSLEMHKVLRKDQIRHEAHQHEVHTWWQPYTKSLNYLKVNRICKMSKKKILFEISSIGTRLSWTPNNIHVIETETRNSNHVFFVLICHVFIPLPPSLLPQSSVTNSWTRKELTNSRTPKSQRKPPNVSLTLSASTLNSTVWATPRHDTPTFLYEFEFVLSVCSHEKMDFYHSYTSWYTENPSLIYSS